MKKLIIGFGGVGLNFLQGQKELLSEHFALVAMSDDEKALECCNVENKLSIESDFEELDKYLIIAKSIVILNGTRAFHLATPRISTWPPCASTLSHRAH